MVGEATQFVTCGPEPGRRATVRYRWRPMTADPSAPQSTAPITADTRWRGVAGLAAVVFLGIGFDAARLETPTVDEFAHVPSGYAVWAHGALDLYSKNPPLGKALLAAPGWLAGAAKVPAVEEPPFGWGPWQYGRRFMRANTDEYFAIFTGARSVALLATLWTAGLVFVWARRLFGECAAATSTSLFLLCPTVLAHGHLATLDMLCTAAIASVLWLLRLAIARGGALHFAATGAALGIACLVKFTGLLLIPVLALVAFLARGREAARALREIALVFGVALMVINAGMAFRGSFSPLGEYRFGSAFATAVQQALPAALPVPAPRDYVRGFDAQKRDIERGEFESYFAGHWSREGVAYYEFAALLLKTPLPLLALLLFTPFALWRAGLPRGELALLLAPVVVLGGLLTALNQLNVGTRYLLPLYPFVFIAAGAAVAGRGGRRTLAAALLVASVALLALRVHPGYLAYFNLAAGGPDAGHRYLLDSNLDWGQDLYRLPQALETLDPEGEAPLHLLYFGHVEPELYGLDFRLPLEHAPGWVAASVSYVKGFSYPAPAPNGRSVPVAPHALAWLAAEEPVAKLGSIWLYDRREATASR